MVMHHWLCGLPAAVAARSRTRAGSRGPRPCAAPGRSASPSRVASGKVRLARAVSAGRTGADAGSPGPPAGPPGLPTRSPAMLLSRSPSLPPRSRSMVLLPPALSLVLLSPPRPLVLPAPPSSLAETSPRLGRWPPPPTCPLPPSRGRVPRGPSPASPLVLPSPSRSLVLPPPPEPLVEASPLPVPFGRVTAGAAMCALAGAAVIAAGTGLRGLGGAVERDAGFEGDAVEEVQERQHAQLIHPRLRAGSSPPCTLRRGR